MISSAYIDSSVILRVVLAQPNPLAEWNEIIDGVTSDLTEVECFRSLDRLHLRRAIASLAAALDGTRTILRRLRMIDVDEPVIREACRPLSIPLRSLDAIHLATALMYRDRQPKDEPPVVFATHDKTLGLAARTMGLRVIGV